MILRVTALLLLVAALSGCATYIPPGEKADLRGIAPADVEVGFNAKPTATFPAGIAAVRVQGPHYRSRSTDESGAVFGTGRFSVITAREVEDQTQLDRITALPQVAGLVSITRMLLPDKLESDRELRAAASRLQADMILLYTFDTAFFDTDSARPLTVISLGLAPTRHIRVTTTASALLVDTRTGYIYSAYETTERSDVSATSWGSRDAADKARLANEKKSFEKLVGEFVTNWLRLLERYGRKG